jgi:aryl-alcohol dehydrogenase-like predicted oxidoreductase
MNFGKRTPEPEAVRIIERAIERGIVHFDTANVYEGGESERILGRAVRGRREGLVIATKAGLARAGGKPEGLSKDRLMRACEESLGRLGVEFIDLYYLHAPDPSTPISETLSAVRALLASGKIRAWGVSNYSAWQILEMLGICEREGLARPAVSQVLYNLLVRQLEIEYFQFAAKYEMPTTIYNPLAGGLLSGHYHPGDAVRSGSRFDGNRMYQRRYWSDRFRDLVEGYRKVAEAEGMTLVDLAYAWAIAQPGVHSILIGPASVAHVDAAVDACRLPVSPEARARIDGMHFEHQGTDAKYAR